MMYCIEVKRGGIGEEDVVLHHYFENKPSRLDVLDVVDKEDLGYDDNYCKLDYYPV